LMDWLPLSSKTRERCFLPNPENECQWSIN
jgi:hypothetical protein